MNHGAALDSLLATIRKRILTHLFLHQSIYAACFGLSALIVLLLVGTQVLNWYWPVLLFAAVLGIGVYRFQSRVPTLYETAQRVDQRLALSDALSTAYHFRTSAEPIAESQRDFAAQLIPSVDVPMAAPFTLPKSVYPAAILAVVALSMFIVRYGMLHSMNLDKPLVEGAFEFFKASGSKKLAQFKQNNPLLAKELEKLGISLEDSGNEQMQQGDEKLPDNLLSSPDIPDVNDLTQGKEVAGKAGVESKDIPSEPGEDGEKGDAGSPGDGKDTGKEADSNNASPSDKGANSPQGKKQDAKEGKNPGNGQSDNPVMDKMRDALANLMNKLKMPNKDGDQQQQQAQGQKGGQKGDGQKKGDNGQQAQNKNANQGEQNGEKEGEGGDKAQDAQGQGSDKASADGQSSPDAKSGVGKSDGNKDVKYAEQLNAMGKISEIMGKRAQNITGEVMVEVSSGKQQLRTQYSDSKATHASTGGEIHRDEVPLEHQQYVQKYFEEVRKGESAARKK